MTKRSETNEADEVEASKALAVTVEPSGASTRTLQVISSEVCAKLAAVLEETLESGLGDGEGGVIDVGRLSRWRRVW